MGRPVRYYRAEMRDPYMGNTLIVTIKITLFNETSGPSKVEIINPEDGITTPAKLIIGEL